MILRFMFGLAFACAAINIAAAQEVCRLEPLGDVEVAAVRDGRTLALRDGRELRLAAIETPASAQAALAQLAAGKTLTLKRLGPDGDRYGRIVAFAFRQGVTQSLQDELLDAGQARVSARVGSKPCADALLTREGAARAAKRGLWADPNFAPFHADHVTELSAQRGHFVLVEGKVASVRQSGGTIYLNFARRWSTGFSVAITARDNAAFAAAGVAPKSLEGRSIRVRGWLEQRRGPLIAASAPEQIEFIH